MTNRRQRIQLIQLPPLLLVLLRKMSATGGSTGVWPTAWTLFLDLPYY